jgi:hypothetical protein
MEQLRTAIERLKTQYEMLGLRVPFNYHLLLEMLTEGLEPTSVRLEVMINSDFRGYVNCDQRIASLQNINSYLEPLEIELMHLKQLIDQQKNDLVSIQSLVNRVTSKMIIHA